MDRLSSFIRAFNDQFGNIEWKDADKIRKVITEELPEKVAQDKAYQNAMKQDVKQNAQIKHDKESFKELLLKRSTITFYQFVPINNLSLYQKNPLS